MARSAAAVNRGVRTETQKLIQYYGEGDYWELFDLGEDPNELHNVCGHPACARVTVDLKHELKRLRASIEYKDVSA